jgi:large subunit ribosomal protein L3
MKSGRVWSSSAKTKRTDGYDAAQLGFMEQKNRASASGDGPLQRRAYRRRVLREVRVDESEEFKTAKRSPHVVRRRGYVDVIGVTKGKGFQATSGGMAWPADRRRTGPASIGRAVRSAIEPGPPACSSTSACPGHMGNKRITIQEFEVVKVRPDDNVILVHGAVMGPSGGSSWSGKRSRRRRRHHEQSYL